MQKVDSSVKLEQVFYLYSNEEVDGELFMI